MSARWFIARNKERVGPFSLWDLQQLARNQMLKPSEFLFLEGTNKWVPAESVPGMFLRPGQIKYWLSIQGKTCGPFAADQVRAGLATRQITLETMVCPENSSHWQPLGKIEEFRNYEPQSVTPSRAQLLLESLEANEASLHLAGKSGDLFAKLISHLMDLKRTYAHNHSLVDSLDKTIAALQQRRKTGVT